MYRQLLVTTTACTLLSLPVFAATVRVESTPGYDFTKFKRYSWRTHPVFEKRPELSEQYSVGIQLVKNAANDHLIGRGFQSTQEPSDFYITFFLTGAARQDVDVVYLDNAYGWGGWYGWSSMYYPSWTQTVTTNYVQGTLVLDIVDVKTNQLVWRAYCRDDIKEWKNRDQNVKKTVVKALKRFPPKK
jgi:uncharacterized protein DUF4136